MVFTFRVCTGAVGNNISMELKARGFDVLRGEFGAFYHTSPRNDYRSEKSEMENVTNNATNTMSTILRGTEHRCRS